MLDYKPQAEKTTVDNYSGYARYQARAGKRQIPVVALRPR